MQLPCKIIVNYINKMNNQEYNNLLKQLRMTVWFPPISAALQQKLNILTFILLGLKACGSWRYKSQVMRLDMNKLLKFSCQLNT